MTSHTLLASDDAQAGTVASAPRRLSVPPIRYLLLALTLIVAALLRLNGLNWDDGRLLHPDERHITDVVVNRIHAPNWAAILDPAHSTLNPRSLDPNPPPGQPPRMRQFAYGSLPLFVTDFVAFLWGKVTGQQWNEFFKVFRVGRALTVGFDLTTVVLAYLLARRAYGELAGQLTAAFYALAVMAIQLAHFWVTDSWLTTFTTAALLASVYAASSNSGRAFALAGLFTGCAVATKSTAILGTVPLAVALLLAHRGQPRRLLANGVAAAGAASLAFLLFEPYAVLDPGTYIRDLAEQSAIISGRFDVPYTRQYVGTIPLVYQAKNLLGWELGPLLGSLVLLGLGYAVWRAISYRRVADLVLLAWVLPYLALLAGQEAKFTRYLLPALPMLLAFGASLLVDAGAFSARARGLMRRPDRARTIATTLAAVVVLAGTGFVAVAFEAIYSRPNTRVAASEWMYQHVPPGSRLSAETWDDPLPLPLGPGKSLADYKYVVMPFDLYNDSPPGVRIPNTEAEFNYIVGRLNSVDYIVESSARLYGSIPRLPWRYPVQQQYYQLLFAGRLGFTPIYEGVSFPALGPWTFNDQFMDESFTVYDHPQVILFKRERTLTRDELRALFAPALERPLSPTRYPPTKSLLLDRLVDQLPAVSDYAWNQTLGRNGAASAVVWLLLLELLGFIGLPVCLRLFHHFPDRGWGLAKLIGWLVVGYPLWLAASLRLARFTLPFTAGALVLAVAVALIAVPRDRHSFLRQLRDARGAILVSEALFLVAWCFFLTLRILNPDLWHTYWGGEKPMELAHLNAILRSVNFPPYDPWFADGTINYYYFGQYLVAVLIKITGIPVEVAFNLAMPGVSALVATAAASVAMAIAAPFLRPGRPPRVLGAFGVLGALFFVGIGNLDGAARLIGMARDSQRAPLDFSYFWGASRAVSGAITEFPYFSQVWADLHAHVIALPFTILAVGIAVALVRASPPELDLDRPAPLLVSSFVAFAPYLLLQALVLGMLAATNSWDVPTYLLVTASSLFISSHFDRAPGAGGSIARVTTATAGTALTGLAAYALFLPFFNGFQALVGSLQRTRVPTPLASYLDHFGLFIVIVAIMLLAAFTLALRRAAVTARSRGWRGVLALVGIAAAVAGYNVTRLTAWLATLLGSRLNWAPTAPIGSDTGALLAVLLVLLVAMLALAWRATPLRLPLVLLTGAVGVTLGPEVVFIADDLLGGDWERMNTVFKFYLQGWTLFALGSIGALAWLYSTAPRWSLAPFRRLRLRADRRANARALQLFAGGFILLLLLASFVYPVVATPLRVREQFARPPGYGPTLDGYRWMEYGTIPNERCEQVSFRDDFAAIQWVNRAISGTPVVAEASIGPYRGNGSRFANATGLPTILGWDRHEYQQRPALGIQARSRDVRLLYNTTNVAEKLSILQRYHVSFVVVGAVERHWYLPAPPGAPACNAAEPYASPAGLRALEGMRGQYLEAVFQAGETVIYRVLPAVYSSGPVTAVPPGMWAPR